VHAGTLVHTPDYRMNARPLLNFPTSILVDGLNESVLFATWSDETNLPGIHETC